MTRKPDAPGKDAQPWLRGELATLCSATDGERRAAIDRWRSCTNPRAFTLVTDKLLDTVKRGSANAQIASKSLIAFGDSVLSHVLRHLVRSHIPKVRVRLLELLAKIPPAADRSAGLPFETTLLTLCHTEREPTVQAAFGLALFQHAPSLRYAALRAAEERIHPGGQECSADDQADGSDEV